MSSLLTVSRYCLSTSFRNSSTFNRAFLVLRKSIDQTPLKQQKLFQSQFKSTLKRRNVEPQVQTPGGIDAAFGLGKGVLAGASALGVGALCFYGMGLSNEPGTLEKSALWPQYIRDRIHTTYMYFGSSLAITASSAYAISRNPTMMRLVTRSGWLSMIASIVVVVGTGMIAQSIPYQPGFGLKQVAWMLHTATLGAIVAPLTLLGGPIMLRAATYTAGIVGGLSTLAVCAPSDKFLYMGGPLAMGLGVVFVSSLGSMFFPTGVLGASLYSISLYGGLALFGCFLLYDTQRIINRAETAPETSLYGMEKFDPINCSISIYLDTLNIFIRMAILLSGGGSSRKR